MRSQMIVRRQAVNAALILDYAHLSYAQRQMHEGSITTEKGRVIDYALEKALNIQDGDALKTEDGQLIVIKAAAEHLIKIEADNITRLLRAALNMGDHHIPTHTTPDALFIQPHPHAEETLRGLGCKLTPVSQAFSPEAVHDHCHHEQHHDHDHSKDHDHSGCCGHHHG